MLLGVAAAILPWLPQDAVESFQSLGRLMQVIGYSIVVFGVFDLIGDTRFDIHTDLRSLLGAIAAYLGYAIALVGAWLIKT